MEKKIRPESIVTKGNMFIYGEYVLSPQQNAFNDLTSYWLTKNLYDVSVYIVSVEAGKSLTVEEAAKQFEQNIAYLEDVNKKAA